MPPELRYYQTDVVNRSRQRMLSSRRGIIQGETGSGKTYVIGHMTECAYRKGSRVLILADRRRLVKQIGAVLEDFGVRYGLVMAGESCATRENVILASRDTFASWLASGRELAPFDLLLIDEAHKSMANVFQGIMSRYPKAYVIGFTATPARDDGKSLGDFYQWLECTVPASKLISEGYLIKPEVYAPVELAKRRKKGEGKGLAGDPVSHWMRHAKGLPTIAFASNRSESMELRDRFLAAGITAEHIDAGVSDDRRDDGRSDRDDFYDRLANGQTQVLCSVSLLVEGVDIPEASAVIVWSKFGSVVKWRQSCGRIMRPCSRINKTKAVVLDHAGAAGEHGLPGEDVDWSLDLASTVSERREKGIEEGRVERTIICQACGLAYSGLKSCPSCGKAAPRNDKKPTMAEQYQASADAILTRFEGDEAKAMLAEQRQRQWYRAMRTAIARNASAGMAAQVFRSACKCMPWEAGVEPLPTNWRQPAREAFGYVFAGV